ncbi:MAG: hypothetical protein RIT27_2206 [Pseudomonadota bacterium]|jgi:hypothetical protein
MLFKRFVIFGTLWLIPCFALWQVSYQTVLLTAFQKTLSPIITVGFVTEQARLHNKENGWVISTTILTPDQPTKDAQRVRVQNIKVEKVVTYLLGFPLLWVLLLATATHRPQTFLKNFFIGNAVLFICVAMALWLKMFLLIATLVSEPNTQIYLSPGVIQTAIPYASWLMVSLQFVQKVVAYICVFIVPIAVWYALLVAEDKKQLFDYRK